MAALDQRVADRAGGVTFTNSGRAESQQIDRVFEKVAARQVVQLAPQRRASRFVMTGLLPGAGAAAVFLFPPAIMAIPWVMNSGIGPSYDVIIGVDGNRVRNTFELLRAVQDAQGGGVFYLTVVRKRRRIQMRVSVPAAQ